MHSLEKKSSIEENKEIISLLDERQDLYLKIKDDLSYIKSLEEKIIYLFPFEVCHVDIIKWYFKYDMDIDEFEKNYKSITEHTQNPVEIIRNLNKLLLN